MAIVRTCPGGTCPGPPMPTGRETHTGSGWCWPGIWWSVRPAGRCTGTRRAARRSASCFHPRTGNLCSALSQRSLPNVADVLTNLLDPQSLLVHLGAVAILVALFAETGLLIGFFL